MRAHGFAQLEPFARSDDDDDIGEAPLVYSPLGCTVSRDGISLQVFIYRGATDAGWLLEIEDHLGGSTVWDDYFATDQVALEAAMQTIEEEGIASFTASAKLA